jgi:hypothetical protein
MLYMHQLHSCTCSTACKTWGGGGKARTGLHYQAAWRCFTWRAATTCCNHTTLALLPLLLPHQMLASLLLVMCLHCSTSRTHCALCAPATAAAATATTAAAGSPLLLAVLLLPAGNSAC